MFSKKDRMVKIKISGSDLAGMDCGLPSDPYLVLSKPGYQGLKRVRISRKVYQWLIIIPGLEDRDYLE